MFTFYFDLPLVPLVLFGAAALLVVPLVFLCFRPLWRVTAAVRRGSDPDVQAPHTVPVSVVVYTSDDAEGLRRCLPAILGQHYEAPFEVIVVNEGQTDTVVPVVERLKAIHDNLYLTFTPNGSRRLSCKKLALMIGIKAARYPVVVQTTSSARIESDEWLAALVAPFANQAIRVVLGFSFLSADNDRAFGRRTRAFNSVADDVAWLEAALAGHPYRGTELNIAYTRQAFFDNRGFSRSLNLKNGDDDIFISEIARADNTAVVVSPDTIVRRVAHNVPRAYRELRTRYRFTGQNLPHGSRMRQALGPWLIYAITALSVVAAAFMWPNLLGVAIAALLVGGTLTAASIMWRRALMALTGRSLRLCLPWLVLTRPFANMSANVRMSRRRKYFFT